MKVKLRLPALFGQIHPAQAVVKVVLNVTALEIQIQVICGPVITEMELVIGAHKNQPIMEAANVI